MSDPTYKFGEFELHPDDGELRSKDTCVRLQEKPLLLLMTLVENPQRIVTRDQLRERMWGANTFVDYEQGINVAIKKVRDALGDSPERPRYVETIAKKGYRFLLAVEVHGSEHIAPGVLAPQPIVTDRRAPRDLSGGPKHSPRRSWIFGAFAIVVLSAAAFSFLKLQPQHARPFTPIRSLAVLPLRNLSPDPGQEYFADGITEELITELAQLTPLRVISRTSVMRYKQTNEPISRIARELGVEVIVEGAVTRSGNRVTVTIQLIDTKEDRHLWAQKYNRSVGDLLDLEAELSHEIASHVGGALRVRNGLRAVKSGPIDPQVHDLCLMGRFHWNKRTAADLAKSAEYFLQAIAREPNYAPAYAGLANAYALMPSYDSVRGEDVYARASAAARRALELDDTLAEAYATLAIIGLNQAADWKQTETEFRRALQLNPSYATAHHWYGYYLLLADRTNEALAEIELARQLDPLSIIINADQGVFLYAVRRYQEAKVPLRRAIELGPEFSQPHETLALIALETGHTSEALNEARTGLALAPTNPRTIGEAGYVLSATGQRSDAMELLATLKTMAQHGSANPVFAALIQVGMGQKKEALDTLEQSKRLGVPFQGISQWHGFDELKSDPRFLKIVSSR